MFDSITRQTGIEQNLISMAARRLWIVQEELRIEDIIRPMPSYFSAHGPSEYKPLKLDKLRNFSVVDRKTDMSPSGIRGRHLESGADVVRALTKREDLKSGTRLRQTVPALIFKGQQAGRIEGNALQAMATALSENAAGDFLKTLSEINPVLAQGLSQAFFGSKTLPQAANLSDADTQNMLAAILISIKSSTH